MKYKIYSYKNGLEKTKLNHKFSNVFLEVCDFLDKIVDEEIIESYNDFNNKSKSISNTLTKILDNKLIFNDWINNTPIYKRKYIAEELFTGNRWTLDYTKEDVSLEISFGHEQGISWNIIKGYIANSESEYEKEININLSLIVCATNKLKKLGGFDNSIGTYEKYIEYFQAFNSIIDYPIVLIGLEGPKSFQIEHRKILNKNKGYLRKIDGGK